MEAGLAEDAILASSLAQARAIWAVRHSVSEGNKRSGYVVSHDSVVPLERQAAFVNNVEARIKAAVRMRMWSCTDISATATSMSWP